MNMNRAAVSAALGLAGNQELTDEDKRYNNSVYRLCKSLYLPTLFSSLTALDWKCARKYGRLVEHERIMYKLADVFYYQTPADCVKPIHVDDNRTDFRVDEDAIITSGAASRLYYVYHNRCLNHLSIAAPLGVVDNENYPFSIGGALDARDAPALGSLDAPLDEPEERDDDFPEWEYTPYDADFWDYFTYQLAARLVPRLRADDGAAGRAQALLTLAENAGAKAVLREKAAETNLNIRPQTWSEKLGTRALYHGEGYGRRRI